MIKELLFFSIGDSNSLSTWSNVPFFFAKTLEKHGIIVHRYNLAQQEKTSILLLYKIWFKILRYIYPNHVQNYRRTRNFKKQAFNIIKQAVSEHPNVDCCLFMGYDFYNKFSAIPTVLFSDWTSDMYFERVKRRAYWFEKRYVKQQSTAIEHASLVFSLFEICAKELQTKHPKIPICFLGKNVINAFQDPNEQIVKEKKSGKILFIGGRKYINGAKALLAAFNLIAKDNPQMTLHIIGMQEKLFPDMRYDANKVHFYGYLRKDVEAEMNLYYKLLSTAQIFVNPSPQWGGYSSTIEAMYFYTPIIVSPYEEFVNEFGEKLNFGLYVNDTIDSLAKSIISIVQNPNYTKLCFNAHEQVSQYTWSHYIEKFLYSVNNVFYKE